MVKVVFGTGEDPPHAPQVREILAMADCLSQEEQNFLQKALTLPALTTKQFRYLQYIYAEASRSYDNGGGCELELDDPFRWGHS